MTWFHAASASAGVVGVTSFGLVGPTPGSVDASCSRGPDPDAVVSAFGTGPLGCIEIGPDLVATGPDLISVGGGGGAASTVDVNDGRSSTGIAASARFAGAGGAGRRGGSIDAPGVVFLNVGP